jgi:uncharacterized protein (TIGR02147 family)
VAKSKKKEIVLEKPLIEIQRFTSFRVFLRATFQSLKKSNPGITFVKFAKVLGLSESSLHMILNGERNLTIHMIHKVASGMELSDPDTRLFEAMVLREQAESSEERVFYSRRLKELKLLSKDLRSVRLASQSVISAWYVPALIVYMIDVLDVKNSGLKEESLTKVADALGLPLEEIQKLLKRLHEDGIFTYDSQDRVHFQFDRIASNLPEVQYLRTCFQQAFKRLELQYGKPGSVFLAHSLSLTEDSFKELAAEYSAMMEKFMSLSTSGSQKIKVAQACFQMFQVFES